ncbi:MAG: nicotinate (nicotinamide) nucleotide adenylyltransferase [Alistipes sp.]|nr:nicotinate (nicotinamide) nucleotide adenylyltransferase [Alistipes sp.]
MLYFGSFNPIHRGHIALAEYAIEHSLCDKVVLVVSPQNPHKPSSELAPEFERFEMAERACKASKYPEKIAPSVVEFMLPRPSYTIDTLRYLKENFSDKMELSILMGCDLINTMDRWKEPEAILENFPIYVYPRSGYELEKFADRVHYLEDAPLCNFSSTEVRRAVERGENTSSMITKEVADHIREKGLYTTASRIVSLTQLIESEGESAEALLERGVCYYRSGEWGRALNDFRRVLELEPENVEAKEFTSMTQEILSYRYTDIYNP